MPKCPFCDTDNPAGSVACGGCFAPMPASADDAHPGSLPLPPRAQRPTGRALTIGGGLAGGFGFILAMFGLSVGAHSADRSDIEAMSRSHQYLSLAGDALWVGFFLLLTGCIVRAIWFLPGDDTKKAP